MATQQLVLLRHAKSDWHSGASTDFDRPLNRRGRAAAPAMGRWLDQQQINPDIILCSPAERTRETLSLVSAECHWDNAGIRMAQGLYHASLSDLLNLVESELEDAQTLMVIGHNPGLEMLLLHYCPDLPVPPDGKLMPTATAAVIDLPTGQSAQLQVLMRPRQIPAN